ncbi:hypothetical protein [Streptomyces sp. 11-1-2]|uniref:hypothetical protein n=1 Tax=unclassified Streptomyces TaxID=2593676 RepID=UPI000B8D9027|nr:hypothetical protein [Streptomyces sp. 11-1-2]ASQ93384.1 hypothetical protein CGL27_09955 [Streptomyces sp. 11-1-2]
MEAASDYSAAASGAALGTGAMLVVFLGAATVAGLCFPPVGALSLGSRGRAVAGSPVAGHPPPR